MAETHVAIEDLPADVVDLDDAGLALIVGGMRMNSGYICTASQGGDCWRE